MAPAPFQMVSELVTPAYIYICLKQSLTCVSGDLITGEQLRHISVHICICYASPADHLCPDFIADYITSTAGTLQPEQPPRPVLITYFLVTTWSRTHQDHYWLHYKRYVVPPTPPQQVVRVIGSQCVSVILYTYICCCPLVTHVNCFSTSPCLWLSDIRRMCWRRSSCIHSYNQAFQLNFSTVTSTLPERSLLSPTPPMDLHLSWTLVLLHLLTEPCLAIPQAPAVCQ